MSLITDLAKLGLFPVRKPAYAPGPVVALLGDSISEQNTLTLTNSLAFRNSGYMTWLNILSGHQFHFLPEYNFGVGGETLPQIAARVSDVLAVNPDVCIVDGGTNDLDNAVFETMRDAMVSILNPLLRAGILVVVLTLPPKDELDTSERKVRQRFNRWLIELGLGRADLVSAAGLPSRAYPIVVDFNKYVTDQSNGNWLTGYSADGIHPNTTSAFWMGYALWEALQPIWPVRYNTWQDAADSYDATLNPGGNLLGTSGTFIGTGGTKTSANGLTVSGDVATGWTVSASSGATSTMTCVCAKENPREDGPNSGERQVLTFATSGAGGATEVKYINKTLVGVGQISAGDVVVLELDYELVSHTGCTAIQLQAREAGPGAPNSAYDGNLVSTGSLIPQVPHKGALRTIPLTLQSGVLSITAWIQIVFDTTGGDAALVLKLSDARLRKIV